MAWFKTGGGALSETILWTNPSPTSSFAAQDVTLSQPITDFTYIKIVCRFSTSNSTEMAALFSPSDFGVQGTYPNKNPSVTMTVSSGAGGTVTRYCAKASSDDNSTIHFFSGSTTTTGSGSTKNGNTIPVAIYGLK